MGRADLHIHTRCSDGFPTIPELLAYVENETSLDVIAVTDHEDAAGGLQARELAVRRGYRVHVVPGVEVTTRHGHLLALFLERTPPLFRSIETTLATVHEWGGLAVVPHPMSWLTRSLSRRTIDRIVAAAEPGVAFDAIETANPSPAGRLTGRRAARLNSAWQLPETGGSDAHHLAHVGTGWTEFAGSGAESFRRALSAGDVRAEMSAYPSMREIGFGRIALGLARGYAATPRKLIAKAFGAGGRR